MDSPLLDDLVTQCRGRLDATMRTSGSRALLTADPFSIRYATGTRNMLVHGLTGPDRSFEAFARGAFSVPEPYRRYGYYQLAHGLGLAGGHRKLCR